MPKEKINDNVSRGWYTEVSWSPAEGDRHGHVQLASVNEQSPFEFPASDDDPAELFNGWRVTHDEQGLTELIKALHKAKRQAFARATEDQS